MLDVSVLSCCSYKYKIQIQDIIIISNSISGGCRIVLTKAFSQFLHLVCLHCPRKTKPLHRRCTIKHAGVIRGSGRQMWAAVINAVTYWGLGVTTAWVFAFYLGLQVIGLWYAWLLATAVQASNHSKTISLSFLGRIPQLLVMEGTESARKESLRKARVDSQILNLGYFKS